MRPGVGREGLVRRLAHNVLTVKKKLTRAGNSVALVLDKPLLEQLGLDEGSDVELLANGDVLVVTPIRQNSRRRKLKKVTDKMDARLRRRISAAR